MQPRPRVQDSPGQVVLVEPGRAVVVEEERGLGSDVRIQAGGRGDGDVAPPAPRGRAGRRVDQMVLGLAAAPPRSLGDAARGEAAAVDRHRCSTREADHDRHRRRQISAGRHPAAAEQRQRIVDRAALDDAVQVERDRLDAKQ
jgi:hypothetical protein